MSDLSREAQAIIDAARGADDPSPGDHQRVRAAVYAELGIPGAGAAASGHGATASSASATGLTTSLVLKLVLGVVLVGGLVAGGVALFRSSAPAPTVSEASVDPIARPESTEPLATAPTSPAPPRIPSEARREAATESKEPAPEATRTKPRTPPRAPAPAPTTLETLRAEKALIDEASRALAAGDGATAMAALDRHARQFPRGQLASERMGTRVLALCAQGRTADAARDAQRFLARYPRHPMAARVRASCAD